MKIAFKLGITTVIALFVWCGTGRAQGVEFPSKEEIGDLVHQAEQKVAEYERVLNAVGKHLPADKLKEDHETVSAARQVISALKTNEPSAYSLVALTVTLDDLNGDAMGDTEAVLKQLVLNAASGKPADAGALSAVVALTDTGNGVRDISELLFHATMRYVHAEESLLADLIAAANKK